ncbi:Reverse transcriptase-like [Sesbania bispinosa]|nr:Reverse transcriptase-like [Sesbania bispinosa]
MDRPNNAQIIQNVHRLGLDILSAFPNIASPQPQCLVAWVPPPHMAIALNMDDNSLGNTGEAGTGGVFRDVTGTWFLAISHELVVSDIRDLLSRSWTLTITHLLREGNELADRLAKKGATCGDSNLQILETPYPELNPILLVDALGLQHLRL